MKWLLITILSVAIFIVGIVTYLAYLVLSGLGELYGPWTKR